MAWITDSLRGAFAALGIRSGLNATTALPNVFNHQLALAAYMSSGMMRKVIRVPAADRTQKWRDWQTDKATIALVEAEEKRLNLRAKVKHAEILRGMGGGALILVTAGQHNEPLIPAAIDKGGLIAVNVASRWELQARDFDLDLASPTYGEPQMFAVSGKAETLIHPSRVICFRGDPVPQGASVEHEEAFWGDSRLLQVYRAVERSDHAKDWFAALIRKAKLLRFGVSNLTDYDQDDLNKRVALIAEGEGVLNATIYNLPTKDGAGGEVGGEKIDDYQVTWIGIPEMMDAFDQNIAAVSDIPFTRLTGRSPAGMNATGQHDQENYRDAVRDGQENETRPCLEKLDPILLRSAGVTATDVWWEWAPLDSPTEKEKAETFKVLVEAIDKLLATGLVPEEAMARATQNLLEERGDLPGLADALKLLSEDERFGLTPEPDDADPSATQAEGGDPDLRAPGAVPPQPRRRAANDAQPRTLYVSRKVENVDDIKAWAKAQGLPGLDDDLHVTIAFSRQPVDWIKMGSTWADAAQNGTGQLIITAGGPRVVEPLGDRTAVLMFASSDLSWRNREMREAGASWDHEDYQPHISLTGEPVDLAKVEPYRGKIVLGPEVFEEIRASALEGAGGGRKANPPFGDANPYRHGKGPRGGQFKSGPGGGGSSVAYVSRATAAGAAQQKQRPIGKVSSSAAALVKSGTGLDIAGKEVRLDHGGVVHAMRNHGPGGTKLAGAKPISPKSLTSAANLLNRSTDIRPGNTRGKLGDRFEVRGAGRSKLTAIFENGPKAVFVVNMWRRK